MVDASSSTGQQQQQQQRAELAQHFGRGLPEDVQSEALSILRLYALTPADLFFKWEAFLLSTAGAASKNNAGGSSSSSSMKNNQVLAFNLENLRELKKEIQMTTGSAAAAAPGTVKREHQQQQGSNGSAMAANRIKKLGGRAALDGILDGLPSTPLAKKARAANGATPSSSSMTPLARNIGAMKPYSAANGIGTPKSALPSHLSRAVHGTPASPAGDNAGLPPASPSSAIPFEERKNRLETLETLNSHLRPIVGSACEASSSRIKLASNADPKAYQYRYMFEKITERAAVLDNTIDEAAELIKEYYAIEDFGNPAHPSQDDHYCVGRICPEADGVRLTDTSVQFETSRRYGGAERVGLRFDSEVVVRSSDDPAYSTGEGGIGLFPGMICGLKGRNAGGGYFTVSEVLQMPPVDQPESTIDDVLSYQHTSSKYLDGQPMSVVVACGPYTVDDNLSFAPLAALLEEMSTLRPDLLILLGPFVDSSHPLIKAGDTDLPPLQLFQQEVGRKIASFLEYSLNTTAVLIPSVRDMVSQHIAYPQSPLERDVLQLHKRAKVLPNPATFSVNEVVFAVTSVDTLFSIKQNEFFKKGKEAAPTSSDGADSSMSVDQAAPKDAMARLCRHVLRQRSFYPLFPSPMAPPLEPLNLDVTHSNLLKFNANAGADVFILPSMLKHFAKVVDSAVMINPASLTKKNTAGTFAKLTIYPIDKRQLEAAKEQIKMSEDEEDDPATDHKVYERCRVDLIRI